MGLVRRARPEQDLTRTLVRKVELRLGLSLQPALRTKLARVAQTLIAKGHATDMLNLIAKVTLATEQDPIVEAFREAASIGETHFFRGLPQLQALKAAVHAHLLKERRTSLRVWSAACATGEEPYSLAILFQSAFPELRVEVLGTDMNGASLAVARVGRYPKTAFREIAPATLSPWVQPEGDGYQVTDALRARVRFAKVNLVIQPLPWVEAGIYNLDVIVCRNVLIYLQPEEIPRVMRKLMASAAPRCIIALTPSEQHAGVSLTGFKPAGLALLVRERLADPPSPSPVAGASPSLEAPARHRKDSSAHRPAVAPSDLLADARSAADRGQFAKARELLLPLLESDAMRAMAHCLLGFIELGAGEPERSVEAHQRALYFDRSLAAAELGLGQALRRLGLTTAAHLHLRRAARLLRSVSTSTVVEPLGVTAEIARRLATAGLTQAEKP